MKFPPGTSVVDSRLGPATVVRATNHGYLVVLERSGLKLERSRDVIFLPDGAGDDEVAMLQPKARVVKEESPGGPRMEVEALRFGVVPNSHMAELTLGFKELQAWVEPLIPRPGEPVRASAVFGAYGSGKTHTMGAIRHIARQRGYLTMATEINGNEVSLAQPRELLASLLDNLAASTNLEGSAPILGLVMTALQGGSISASERAPALASAQTVVRKLSADGQVDELEDLLERLLSSDPSLNKTDFTSELRERLPWQSLDRVLYGPLPPRPLVCWTPVDRRPYEFAQALIGYASIARRAGFEGLVVTVDEVEVEDALRRAQTWPKVLHFVSAMGQELGRRDALDAGLGIFLAAVGGGRTVEDSIVEGIVGLAEGGTYVMPNWDRSDLQLLSTRILDLYRDAYALTAPHDPELANRALAQLDKYDIEDSGEIRAFVRAYVSLLDITYGPPA